MRASLRIVLVWLVGCGDNAVPPPDASSTCTARFSGNFDEQQASPETCPSLQAGALHVELPVAAIDATLTIDIAGARSIGHYAPATVPSWSAFALRKNGNQACAYSAGSSATPQGTFELALDDISPPAVPHGSLTMTINVLTFPNSACGDGDTELVELAF